MYSHRRTADTPIPSLKKLSLEAIPIHKLYKLPAHILLKANLDSEEWRREWIKEVITKQSELGRIRIFGGVKSKLPEIPMTKFLTELTLRNIENLKAKAIFGFIARAESLEILDLANTETLNTLPKLPTQLRVLNVANTKIKGHDVLRAIKGCKSIEVLNLTGIKMLDSRRKAWRDTLSRADEEGLCLDRLVKLKLRNSDTNTAFLSVLTEFAFNIEHLDISLTAVDSIKCLHTLMKLEKLNMIIPGFPFHALADFLNSEHRRSLQILAFDITNIDVEEMATIVEQIGDHSLSLRKLVMVGKPTTWPLQSDWSMLCAVLQRIEYLDVTGLHFPAEFLLAIFQGSSKLHHLILSGSYIDDYMLMPIRSPVLRTLWLSRSMVTEKGIFPLIQRCPQLEELNVERCRGIATTRRRCMFETYNEWASNQLSPAATPEGTLS